jgi:hypothetical protein
MAQGTGHWCDMIRYGVPPESEPPTKRTEFRALLLQGRDGLEVLDERGKHEWTLAELLPEGTHGRPYCYRVTVEAWPVDE